ncbi:hypothetical protein ACBG90_22035 [Stutzerimonas kunmingensis]|uniref:hypothetical protein n=1 Tax=Stutzerimonas kunmingensis TaxID=1211807 RepID=UPI003523F22C
MALRISLYLLLALAVGIYPESSYASCSDRKIRSLADQGNTISAIAEWCEKSSRYVNRILNEDTGDMEKEEDRVNSLAPSGTAISSCGCWGAAFPGAQIPDNRCQSGYAIARACTAMCQAGGAMWQTYCQ